MPSSGASSFCPADTLSAGSNGLTLPICGAMDVTKPASCNDFSTDATIDAHLT